jgi:hypothetical protein
MSFVSTSTLLCAWQSYALIPKYSMSAGGSAAGDWCSGSASTEWPSPKVREWDQREAAALHVHMHILHRDTYLQAEERQATALLVVAVASCRDCSGPRYVVCFLLRDQPQVRAILHPHLLKAQPWA